MSHGHENSKCRKFKTARIIISGKDAKSHTLTIFNDLIDTIVDGVEGPMTLLTAPPFIYSVDKKDIVFPVRKM